MISIAAVSSLWGKTAHADPSPPPPAPSPAPTAPAPAPAATRAPAPPASAAPSVNPAPAAPAPATSPGPAAGSAAPAAAPAGNPAEPSAPPGLPPTAIEGEAAPDDQGAGPTSGLSDAQLAKLAEGESIEIFDERPDKPFDRDTEVRLTGEDLAARGATDLGTALALLPDVSVRDAGRGGFNIDVRGARKGAVSILIDGVLVTDPYYGTFDVSTIPITDIVQIRVATTPQSPIDGPGGPGGVIEVHTRDAIGSTMAIARITADSLPSLGATGTARIPLAKHLALRVSGSGVDGARDLPLPGDTTIGEDRRSGTGSARLEYRDGERRLALDGFLDDRHYVSPPSDEDRSSILLIDRETTARAGLKYDDKFGAVQVQGEGWTQYLYRRSRYFSDPAMSNEQQLEDLSALRTGGMALVTAPFWHDFRWALATTIDHETADVENITHQTVHGDTTIIEPGADLQYEHKRFRGDVSGGAAIPFGVGADPWPEGKAVAKYRAADGLDLTATGAYKGRVPSLRERFDLATGNPALGPERIAHGEVRAIEQINDLLHIEIAPFYKRSTGTIRASTLPSDNGKLINLGVVTFYGVDTQARVTINPMFEVGGAYGYIKAHDEDNGTDDPLDRLPHNKWEAWVQARPERRFSGLARVSYFGQSISTGMTVPGYTIVELDASAQITKQYFVVVRCDDLLDEQPETRAGYHTPGRIISTVLQGTWE
ncbi:MAG TPA: TonB-dependent receptor plug domain-containing protein [Kofleriaceae bacterium]|nr:TonB-dependent receptor plug domain-containing protein [Kofleriaceae bacterium]